MKYLLILPLLFMMGCDFPKIEKSRLLEESAVVSETIHTDAHSDMDYGPTIGWDGEFGMGWSTTHVPEKWGVVFKCKHGKFVVQGYGSKYKELWSKMEARDNVIIKYHEIYKVYKKKKRREFYDFDFIDAVVVKNE